MYRNFNAAALGVSGRQSELLEIALTYRFKGIDVDVADLVKRAKGSTVENACKYLVSANMKIGGFEVPVRWRGTDAEFQADIHDLGPMAEIAQAIGATLAHTTVLASSPTLPFHENFKFHTDRLTELGKALAAHDLRLAVGFQAAKEFRPEGQYEFVHNATAMLELLSAVQAKNVGLMLDVWTWHVGGGKLDQIKSLSPERLMSVRLADIAPDADLSQIAATSRLLPGEGGAVDVPSYVALLDQIDYKGPITPFPHPSQFLGRTRESNVQRASSALDKLWVEAGLADPLPVMPPIPFSQGEEEGDER